MIIRRTRRALASIGLLALLSFSAPEKAYTLELGMTPSDVYALWLNINTVFIELEREALQNPDTLAEIETMQPLLFEGKNPGNVLLRATSLREMLEEEFGHQGLHTTPKWIIDFQILEGGVSEEPTTPSEVFILSSQILSLLVDKYVEVTSGARPIARFYRDDGTVSGKAPSDVFGLVDLLGRRLDKFLSGRPISPTANKESR